MQRTTERDRLALIQRSLVDIRSMLGAMQQSPQVAALLGRGDVLDRRVAEWSTATPTSREIADVLAEVLDLNMAASKLRRDVSG